MPFVPHTPEETQEMLACIGVDSLDNLFACIPAGMRPKHFNLPDGLSEYESCSRLEDMAGRNKHPSISFMGGGFYDHSIPKAVDALSGRGEFLTAYTPYQAEAAQGTLQAIFEYQTVVTRLMGMDVANASVYDAGSALFEAAMMAARATGRTRFVLDEGVNPLYRSMLNTLTANLSMKILTIKRDKTGLPDLNALNGAIDGQTAAVMVQNPTFFGNVLDYTDLFQQAKTVGALSVLCVYPVMQAVLKTPGEMRADIAVADGQSVGQPLNFGGPYLGMMACSKALIRQLPGRIAGRTVDLEGKTGYVLTLQAREQHIRRAKATSNICSNQALCALRSLIHISLLGPEGLIKTAERSLELSRYAEAKLCALPGVTRLNNAPFGNELALRLPGPAKDFYASLAREGIIAGTLPGHWYEGEENTLLVACTEKNTESQIDRFAAALKMRIKP
ncbi:MAG: aminomethyl-transferring glycine dehydrogenase subunit GcvPA [Deltaproteobacteria bacterium]|jgi:glycine dehydrogenase subunit 1|nr:aminomethyl-transferring glycine dehydrogenase subunit GcvPA [Deltaproteobacteria bacterium]